MTEQTRPVNVVNIVTGLCFVALGVLLIMNRAGTLDVQQIIQLWPLVLILLGAAVAWQASRGEDAAGSVASGAGPLVWLVILGLLFSHVFDRRAAADADAADGRMNVFAVMGGQERPVSTGAFSGATVTTVMGGAKIDLTTASLAPGETAVIDVFTVMGGVDILAPRDWRVDIEATAVAAGVTDRRSGEASDDPPTSDEASTDSAPEANVGQKATGVVEPAGDRELAPRLVVKGFVMMGGVNVRSPAP